jgi:hypothetical protein
MLTINKPKDVEFSDYLRQLRIVPVSISYEFDPCDMSKAKELHQLDLLGTYDKPDNEDMRSIVNGITGQKGRVHVHFGKVLAAGFESPKQVAEHLDSEILAGYRCFSTGEAALSLLQQQGTEQSISSVSANTEMDQALQYLQTRLSSLNAAEQEKMLLMYANPFQKKLSKSH